MRAKLEKSKDFRERMRAKDENYRVNIQRAYYSNLSMINPQIIQEAGIDISNRPVYVFYGMLQPE
jgi:hypothetical protein